LASMHGACRPRRRAASARAVSLHDALPSLSSYDRLVSFGRKQLNGKWVFDLDTITGELAESYSVSADGLKITFKLRPDAKFQDRSEEHTSELQSHLNLVCRLLLEKEKQRPG